MSEFYDETTNLPGELPEYDQLLVNSTLLSAILRYTKMSEYNPDKKVILAIAGETDEE